MISEGKLCKEQPERNEHVWFDGVWLVVTNECSLKQWKTRFGLSSYKEMHLNFNNQQPVFPHALVPTGGVNHTYSDTSVYGRAVRGSSGRTGALLFHLEGNRCHGCCHWLSEVACIRANPVTRIHVQRDECLPPLPLHPFLPIPLPQRALHNACMEY